MSILQKFQGEVWLDKKKWKSNYLLKDISSGWDYYVSCSGSE